MTLEAVLRLLLAAALGALVGFQREYEKKPAGLRTHTIVCVGACLFCLVSIYGFGENADPSRIAAQVVTGIGFIGAGTVIFLSRQHVVVGLTTAATVWSVAAIGLAAGAGLYVLAVVGTLIVFGALYIPHHF
ncbi:MAG: MgtC/SapB family protein [Dehalococcoidia bacterium]|nr:MgtC/SapB family protein [Dehalococcoidia bacterium]